MLKVSTQNPQDGDSFSGTPDFICLGAQKSGTTWLYRQLAKHQSIQMPVQKELRQFHPWNGDRRRYSRVFAEAHANGKISGDMTPEYLVSEAAPQQIKEMKADVKVFAILRNPVDRAFSQYLMGMYLGNFPTGLSFLECFKNGSNYMAKRGMYANQIKCYQRFFTLGKDLQVYFYEDLLADHAGFLKAVHEFIGVPHVLPDGLTDWVENQYPAQAMSEEDRAYVSEFYHKPNQDLFRLLGRSW